MPPLDLNRFLQQLRNHPLLSPRFCDTCGHEHDISDLNMISSANSNMIFQLSCRSCGLVQVLRVSPGAPMAIQRFENNNSDIAGQELQKFAGKPSVHNEEALDVFADMQEVNNLGDFLRWVDTSEK